MRAPDQQRLAAVSNDPWPPEMLFCVEFGGWWCRMMNELCFQLEVQFGVVVGSRPKIQALSALSGCFAGADFQAPI